METSRRNTVLCLVVTLTGLLFVACGGGSGGGDGSTDVSGGDPPPGTDIRVGDYFPLSQGDSWTYREEDGEYTTKTVSGTETISGVLTTKLIDEDGDYQLWTNTDGISWYKEYDADDIQGCGWEIHEFEPPLIASTNFASIGDSFNSTSTLTETDCRGNFSEDEISYEFIIEGYEDVSVPAGTFAGCLKIVGTLRLDDPGGVDRTSVLTIWLAKDIGPVKTTNRSQEGETVQMWTSDLVHAEVSGVRYP